MSPASDKEPVALARHPEMTSPLAQSRFLLKMTNPVCGRKPTGSENTALSG